MFNTNQKELVTFFRNYSNTVNGDDFKLKVDLTYSKSVIDTSKCRRSIINLKRHLNKIGIRMNGVYVNEYSKVFHLHNHCLIWVDCDWEIGKKYIKNYWSKIGLSLIEKYDSKLGGCEYMVKHIGVNQNNNWDLIENL